MADALDLGSSVERRVGSSPTFRTSAKEKTSEFLRGFFVSKSRYFGLGQCRRSGHGRPGIHDSDSTELLGLTLAPGWELCDC